VHLDGILENTIRYWEAQLGPQAMVSTIRRPRRFTHSLNHFHPAGIVA
jgi:hypothetical protein